MLQLDNRRIHKFENIDMLQSLMDTHLFFYGFSIFVGGLRCKGNKFARCYAMICYVDSSEDSNK